MNKKLLLCLALMLSPVAAQAQTFPDRKGLAVVDEANILPDSEERILNNRIVAWNKSTGRQLVVAVPASLQGLSIKDYGYKLGRFWKLGNGQMASESTGAIIIYAPKEKIARVEVGRGLEYVLTDAVSKDIIDDVILPRARENDPMGAVTAASEAIMSITAPPPAVMPQKAATAPSTKSDSSGFGWILIGLVAILGAAGAVLIRQSRKEEELEIERLRKIREEEEKEAVFRAEQLERRKNSAAGSSYKPPLDLDIPRGAAGLQAAPRHIGSPGRYSKSDLAALEAAQRQVHRDPTPPKAARYVPPSKARPVAPTPTPRPSRSYDNDSASDFITGAAIGSMFGSSDNSNDDSNRNSYTAPSSDTFDSGGSDNGFGGGGADGGWGGND
jgi:uncharacterized protein